MPHLHLSLQAGSDLILKRMKRRHPAPSAAGHDRPRARAASGHRRRRRPDRGLPDRDGGAVRRDARLRAGSRHPVSCTSSPTASVPARRPRACRRCPRRFAASRAARLREAGRDAARLSTRPGWPAQVIGAGRADTAGHTEHFAPVRVGAGRWPPVARPDAPADEHGLVAAESPAWATWRWAASSRA